MLSAAHSSGSTPRRSHTHVVPGLYVLTAVHFASLPSAKLRPESSNSSEKTSFKAVPAFFERSRVVLAAGGVSLSTEEGAAGQHDEMSRS